MGLWARFFRWRDDPDVQDRVRAESDPGAAVEQERNTIALPAVPFVFECQLCGKVFDARRKRPPCPECDSTEVLLLSG